MNQKERRECVFNLYENKVNFEIFENILNKIGCHKGGLVPAINRMSIDDWVKHYKEYCENIIITKEQIVITFDYLEKYYNGFIKKISPKIDNIYLLENNFIKIDCSYEYEILKTIQKSKN